MLINGLIIFSQESFYVYFKQNGKRININNSKVELKKQPFDIYVEYTAPMNLLVSSSFNSKTWKSAKNGKLLSDMPVFLIKKKKLSTLFDYQGTLVLCPDKPFSWEKFQSDTTKITSSKGRQINIKKVLKLYSESDSSDVYPQNFKEDVYLVFIYAQKDKDGDLLEIQREYVKISWVKKFDEETKAYERKQKALQKEKIRQAKTALKNKQKQAEKEKKRLKRLEKEEQKRLEKEKKKAEKKAKKEQKKEDKNNG